MRDVWELRLMHAFTPRSSKSVGGLPIDVQTQTSID
ncbi:L-cystine uptake protein TcyP (sodium:dicarboxylate symporter family) [Metabacillus malikii]|uniref:L-cystine uptake protein TcyP (Sodium:dicarboxylate symporter family) n=1 Tax=Metabacillus malikii TaxID=1504265 RepID=A0ABT9ZBD5_9BACI|nr:L-cystine uptake protein TcyP (sodium:dicarboxylate symporter family) [Metabacillus malikii]